MRPGPPLLLAGGLLALELAALAAAAPEEGTCSAREGGPGCSDSNPGGLSDDELKCVRWRQTGGCSPNGPRERKGDKHCTEEVPTGASGFCQCGAEHHGVRVRESTCDHRPFRCATECLQARRYMCVAWRQTGGCRSDGARQPDSDRSCGESIDPMLSGYCECGDGRVVRKAGCSYGEFEEPFTCRDECAGEPGLYEELDVDASATEREIKQAFRKMSLKYHPDKTMNDVVLSARFTSIRDAYDTISDPRLRSIYDSAGLKTVYEARNRQIEDGPSSTGEYAVTLEGMYNGHDGKTTIRRKVICRGCADSSTPRCRKCTEQCAHEVQLVNVRMGPMVVQQKQQVRSKQRCRMVNVELDVNVERGSRSGDTLTYQGMSEQQPNKVPGDLVLTLREEKHRLFDRVGIDLHTEATVSLREALLGFERTLELLDGRRLTIDHTGVTWPFGVMKVEGEGMPLKGDPTQHGSLFLKFRIVMPEDGRQWLRDNALPGGASSEEAPSEEAPSEEAAPPDGAPPEGAPSERSPPEGSPE